jgi:hypothetical protein
LQLFQNSIYSFEKASEGTEMTENYSCESCSR